VIEWLEGVLTGVGNVKKKTPAKKKPVAAAV